jgi:Protein of unknown function (DUF2523)
MFGILTSALFSVLGWLVKSVLIKFGVFFALYFITTGFVSLIVGLLPNGSSVNSALSGIGQATWFFLDVFMLQVGLSAVISAYATRFIIRRIPVIG